MKEAEEERRGVPGERGRRSWFKVSVRGGRWGGGSLREGSAEQQGREELRGYGNLGGAEWTFQLFRPRVSWVYSGQGGRVLRQGELKGREKAGGRLEEEAWS